jgi:hypothetical protein
LPIASGASAGSPSLNTAGERCMGAPSSPSATPTLGRTFLPDTEYHRRQRPPSSGSTTLVKFWTNPDSSEASTVPRLCHGLDFKRTGGCSEMSDAAAAHVVGTTPALTATAVLFRNNRLSILLMDIAPCVFVIRPRRTSGGWKTMIH